MTAPIRNYLNNNICRNDSMTKNRIFPVFALLILLSISFNVPAYQESSLNTGLAADELIAGADRLIPGLLEKNNVPGLSLALIQNGRIICIKPYGIKDSKTGEPVEENTVFEAASLSKPVFTYAVLKLADQGSIDLDRPLYEYWQEEYIDNDERYKKITPRIVMTHSTGFPNWRRNKKLTINFEPGTRFSYSGEGFVYLQKVVEHITGKELNELMRELVFTPLGMENSSYIWLDDYSDTASKCHNDKGEQRGKGRPSKANAAASLHTTAGDFAKFMICIMNGSGLKSSTSEDMLTPGIRVSDRHGKTANKSLYWGLGFGLQDTVDGKAFWHWGDNMNFKCYAVGYRELKFGLVYFSNGKNGLNFGDELISGILGGNHPALEWLDYH